MSNRRKVFEKNGIYLYDRMAYDNFGRLSNDMKILLTT